MTPREVIERRERAARDAAAHREAAGDALREAVALCHEAIYDLDTIRAALKRLCARLQSPMDDRWRTLLTALTGGDPSNRGPWSRYDLLRVEGWSMPTSHGLADECDAVIREAQP